MAMNREMKRMLQKQGEVGADGEPVRKQRSTPRAPAPKKAGSQEKDAHLFSRQGIREVRAELRKVVWPTRQEAMRTTWVVIIAVIAMSLILAVFDLIVKFGVEKLLGT